MVVGSAGANAGYATYFEKVSGQWVQHQIVRPNDPQYAHFFGGWVVMSGDSLVIGAPNDNDVYTFGGSAYVYEFVADEWLFVEEIRPLDLEVYDNFGWDIVASPNGEFLVVGAPRKKNNGLSTVGAAYVFERSGSSWVQRQKLLASDWAEGALFGNDISMTDDVLVIGSQWRDPLSTGAVYVFEKDLGTGDWVETQKLMMPGYIGFEHFGVSTAVSGDQILVGAVGWQNISGAACLFRKLAGTWQFEQQFVSMFPTANRGYGIEVAFVHGEPLVFANDVDLAPWFEGGVDHWRRTILGWRRADRIQAPEPLVELSMGFRMAVDGRTAVFSANDQVPYQETGSIYLYDFSETTRFCPSSVNSSGNAASIDWGGSTLLGQSTLDLMSAGCPPGETGVFYFGSAPISVPFGNGTRCVGGVTRRLPVVQTSGSGTIETALRPSGPVGILTPGSTWNFQFWFRDPAAGGAAFDLSDAIEIQFCL